MITDQVVAVLLAGRLAHLVTLNPDGSPQISLVWVGIEGNQIVSGSPTLGIFDRCKGLDDLLPGAGIQLGAHRRRQREVAA